MDGLDNLRNEIDSIDNSILELLSKRKKTITKIASIKKKLSKPIIDNERENQIVERLKKLSKENGLDENFIISIYKVILNNSRDEQKSSE